MHAIPTATVCRTVVVLAFLLPLAATGRPGWAAAGLALCLVALWAAPVLVAGRRPVEEAAAGLAAEPGEAPAGCQVSSAIASMPNQMPKAKNSAAAP